MTTKHRNRYSTLLVFRELQMKTTMTYHYTSIKTAKIKEGKNPTLVIPRAGEGTNHWSSEALLMGT